MTSTKSTPKKPAVKATTEKPGSETENARVNSFITVEVSAFSRALAAVTSVVESRATLPILSNLMIRHDNGTVYFAATNLDMEIRMPHNPVDFGGGDDDKGLIATTVGAKHLHAIFASLDEGAQARLEYDEAAGRMIVTSGAARFKLPTLPVEDFPTMGMMGDAAILTFVAGDLRAVLHRLAFAQCNDETRYYLNGIHMHRSDDGTLHLAATDGHNLAHENMQLATGPVPENLPPVIIARATVAVLEKLLAGIDVEAQIDIEVSGSKINASIGDSQLIAKLIDGSFPDYKRVIPQHNDLVASLDRAQLALISRRVQILADTKSRAVKCSFATDKLTLSVHSLETGEAKEEMLVSYGGPEINIGLNGKYLLAQMAAHVSPTITLAMADPNAPVRIEPVAHGNDPVPKYLTVLMPMAI